LATTRLGGTPRRSRGAPARFTQATGRPKERAPEASQALDETNRIRSAGRLKALSASS
jgi:hypothetical protein